MSSGLTRKADYELIIAGTAGVPGSYGGFETLAEQLVISLSDSVNMLVICSGSTVQNHQQSFHGARLKYLPLSANGASSVLYDVLGLLYCCWRTKYVLQLGVSGAIAIPLVKILHPTLVVVCNVDGIEWRRGKWGFFARHFLKFSEWIAVRFSNVVVADNQAIADYLKAEYGTDAKVSAYGGNHVVRLKGSAPSEAVASKMSSVHGRYFYGLCRVVPENNVEKILAAFAMAGMPNLVFVGDWKNGRYARELYDEYGSTPNIFLLNPIYDQDDLTYIRAGADGYIHGHSAGGTNPSLVEAMYFGSACVAYACNFNGYTLGGTGVLWTDASDLARIILTTTTAEFADSAKNASTYARKHYDWAFIAEQYREVGLHKERA